MKKPQKSKNLVILSVSDYTTEPISLSDFGRLTAEGRNPSGKDFMTLARLGEEFK
jgi:hypothetical protein